MGVLISEKRNVKIFVLYLLENINAPLDFVTINDIVMQNDYVMYLDFAEAFHEMVDMHLIDKFEEDGKELYLITDRGRLVARELKSDLLTSMLDKSLAQALRYLDFKKRKIVTRCTVEKTDDAVKYDKIQPEQRIDLFDASVFACIKFLNQAEKDKQAAGWWS